MRKKRGPKYYYEKKIMEPFRSAEEAWFWYARCQKLRLLGVRLDETSSMTCRPCDPDDLYRAALSLRRSGRLQGRHLTVLGEFGVAERPPDPRCDEEQPQARLWDEALDAMATILKRKGIIS